VTKTSSEEFFVKELTNGVVLLGQRMPNVSSAAMTILTPAGASLDRTGAEGAAPVATEWCMRGAGERNTRELNEALDSLGCRHHESVTSAHIQFSVAQLGSRLHEVLSVYADILRRPRLEEATFEPSRALALQDLISLEDEPARKWNMLLREKFYPYPLGRCVLGRAETIRNLKSQTVREHIGKHFTPEGTIIAVAGMLDWNAFCDCTEQLFGDWSVEESQAIAPRAAEGGVTHIKKESAQAHIAIAHRSVPVSHEHYYAARMAETLLSGGMSSRLFTEVRQKRGLVYHVSCSYHSLKNHAGMFTYAGTRPELAQETFDVTISELRRLAQGIQREELVRSRTRLKSALVMQGESTSARANVLAGDWYHLGHLRSLRELLQRIDATTAEDVLAYLAEFPAEDFAALTIGPQPVSTSIIDG